ARDRKLTPDEMQGGNFSISNLGGIGGHAFTPIVNPPYVAILGVSRSKMTPVWNPETSTFEPRLMMPLALTYDHRLIDGAAAARFLRWVCTALEDPFLVALEGCSRPTRFPRWRTGHPVRQLAFLRHWGPWEGKRFTRLSRSCVIASHRMSALNSVANGVNPAPTGVELRATGLV